MKRFLFVDDNKLIERAAKALAQYYLGRVKGKYIGLLKEEMYSRPSLRSDDGKTISPMIWELVKKYAIVIQRDIEKREGAQNGNSWN